MKLAIFDIDHTLARTAPVFDPYFFEALAAQLGEKGMRRDLGAWRNVTDQGIVEEAIEWAGRDPATVDIPTIRAQYVASMRAHVGGAEMIPGADTVLARLRADPGWRVAIATGNWDEPGRIKLARAGLDIDGLPYAGCDERPSRVEVMQRALALAEADHGGAFERIVYVGDAPWDIEASRDLGWPFVGISDPPSRLLDLGASHAFVDLGDTERVLEALERARPPPPAVA